MFISADACSRAAGRRGADGQSGASLIELIAFIIMISVGIVGLLSVMSSMTRDSADPMVRKQSIAMADAVLEEVLTKNYSGTSSETVRADMDDVDDYAYFDGSTTAKRILGSQMLGSSSGPLPDTFWAKVEVAPVTVSGVAMKKITVTVTDPTGAGYALSGYRADF